MNFIKVFNKNAENIKIESKFWDLIRTILTKINGKNGEYRNENWVKILSDSYKIAILVRKNGENAGIWKWKLGQTLSPY